MYEYSLLHKYYQQVQHVYMKVDYFLKSSDVKAAYYNELV